MSEEVTNRQLYEVLCKINQNLEAFMVLEHADKNSFHYPTYRAVILMLLWPSSR